MRPDAIPKLRAGCSSALPLVARRQRLESVLDGAPAVLLPVRRLADDGLKAWQQVLEHGFEGLVAKDAASPYVAGRTLRWLKVKQPHTGKGSADGNPRRSAAWPALARRLLLAAGGGSARRNGRLSRSGSSIPRSPRWTGRT
jgi:hypothetical protein